MKDFKAQYPVVGTAALKAHASKSQAQAAIIAFPRDLPKARHRASAAHAAPAAHSGSATVMSTRLMRNLNSGSVRGKAFNRIAPWQVATAGAFLSIAALVAIFV